MNFINSFHFSHASQGTSLPTRSPITGLVASYWYRFCGDTPQLVLWWRTTWLLVSDDRSPAAIMDYQSCGDRRPVEMDWSCAGGGWQVLCWRRNDWSRGGRRSVSFRRLPCLWVTTIIIIIIILFCHTEELWRKNATRPLRSLLMIEELKTDLATVDGSAMVVHTVSWRRSTMDL